MAVTYTTAAIVKKRSNQLSASLADEDIDENIMQAESVIDAAMKKTARGADPDFTFDADKHGMLRDCATNYATHSSLLFDLTEFSTYDFARVALEELRRSVESMLIALSDSEIVAYLEGL